MDFVAAAVAAAVDSEKGALIQMMAGHHLACPNVYADQWMKQRDGGELESLVLPSWQYENDHPPSKLDWYANPVPHTHVVVVVAAAAENDFSCDILHYDVGRRVLANHFVAAAYELDNVGERRHLVNHFLREVWNQEVVLPPPRFDQLFVVDVDIELPEPPDGGNQPWMVELDVQD